MEKLLDSPTLPEMMGELEARLAEERARREKPGDSEPPRYSYPLSALC